MARPDSAESPSPTKHKSLFDKSDEMQYGEGCNSCLNNQYQPYKESNVNIINVLTWIGVAFLVWSVISAFIVATMKHRDPKSWHGWMISLAGEFWDEYLFYTLDNTCSYWLALVFLPFVLLTMLVAFIVAMIIYFIVIFCKVIYRLFWFSMNGETSYLSKDVKEMFTETFEDSQLLGSNSFRFTRSPAVLLFAMWVAYHLFLFDYGAVIVSATATVKQVNWSGNLMILGAFLGACIGLVLVGKGVKMAWPTIKKAWSILRGKVCYELPYKKETTAT